MQHNPPVEKRMSTDPAPPKLPPNQALTARGKWPVVGERQPAQRDEAWTLSITGLVEKPHQWTLQELHAMEQIERQIDIHCVTRWSKPNATFHGIPLLSLLTPCKPLPQARYVSFIARSEHKHSTSLPLASLAQLDPLVAFSFDHKPLTTEHGGPIRTIVPNKYFYKSLKWLETILLLEEDQPGTWEREAGYHNNADPWREQRYIASNLSRKQSAALLQQRNLSHQELLSLEAKHLDLQKLNATHALLRNANFSHANLQYADFSHANLSNANFQHANLQHADFSHADVEGASFCGANLKGANLQHASIFGASFAPEPHDPPSITPATVDKDTLSQDQISLLSDAQQAFLHTQTS